MKDKFIQDIFSSGVLEKIYQEDGCLGYSYYYPVQDEDKVFLLEQWDTEEHQKIHLRQSHMEKLKSITNLYVIDIHFEKSFLT